MKTVMNSIFEANISKFCENLVTTALYEKSWTELFKYWILCDLRKFIRLTVKQF